MPMGVGTHRQIVANAMHRAAQAPQAAVQFGGDDDTGALQQTIDVLGDDVDARMLGLHRADVRVAGVWRAAPHLGAAQFVEVQHLHRVTVEGTLAGIVLIVVFAPDAADAAIGRHARIPPTGRRR